MSEPMPMQTARFDMRGAVVTAYSKKKPYPYMELHPVTWTFQRRQKLGGNLVYDLLGS